MTKIISISGISGSGKTTDIDFLVYLDTPLDIALGRRILRDHQSLPHPDVRKIIQEIELYLTSARPVYLSCDTIKNAADLILDGSLSIHELLSSPHFSNF